MSGLLLAADAPPRFSAPFVKRRRLFESEAERFAWIAAEYRRVLKPGLRKGAALNVTLEAFGVSLDDLNKPGTQPRIRAKVMCTVLILSGASYADIAAKFGVGRSAACRAYHRLHAEVSAMLGLGGNAS